MKDSIKHDEKNTVACQDQKRRKSKSHDPAYHACLKSAPAQTNRHFMAAKRQQYKCTGCHLRDDRSNGCTGNTHMKNKDEHGIKNNVEDSTKYNRCHAKTGESLCNQKAVEPTTDQCKKCTGSIDGYIGVSIRKGGLTGSKPHEKLILGKQKKSCQNCGQDKQHEKSIIQGLLCTFMVTASHLHGHDRSTTLTDHGTK